MCDAVFGLTSYMYNDNFIMCAHARFMIMSPPHCGRAHDCKERSRVLPIYPNTRRVVRRSQHCRCVGKIRRVCHETRGVLRSLLLSHKLLTKESEAAMSRVSVARGPAEYSVLPVEAFLDGQRR